MFYNIIKAINAAVNLKFYYCRARSKQYSFIWLYVTIFFFLTVKLMFLSWNWEKVYSKMIVKSIFRCRKTINSPKNCYWEKTTLQRMISSHSLHSSRRWQQQLNNTHLFSLLSVNKFKRFLLCFLIKQMVNFSSCTVELWMHSGDSGLLSSRQLQQLLIVYWRHQCAQFLVFTRGHQNSN